MTEETDPFAAFKEGQPPAETPPAAGKKKKIAKKRNGKVSSTPKVTAKMADATPTPKKERKTRKPRAVKEFRLPISTFLEIGSLSSEEGAALMTIATGLQKMPKRARSKIVAALGKIFG